MKPLYKEYIIEFIGLLFWLLCYAKLVLLVIINLFFSIYLLLYFHTIISLLFSVFHMLEMLNFMFGTLNSLTSSEMQRCSPKSITILRSKFNPLNRNREF